MLQAKGFCTQRECLSRWGKALCSGKSGAFDWGVVFVAILPLLFCWEW